MCSRPSTSLPLLMRWRVVASVFSSTDIVLYSIAREFFPAIFANTFEIAAASSATILAQQELRSKERYQLSLLGAAERAPDDGTNHWPPLCRIPAPGRVRRRRGPSSCARRRSGRCCPAD